MRDFRGHELQVGDIAITGALDELSFDWVQIVRFIAEDEPETSSVAIVPVQDLTLAQPPRTYVDASQLIWHSSDYATMLGHQVAAVFGGV